MSLLQLLQEASSLKLDSLKKAMMKDERVKVLFKKDLKLDDIPDKDAFLATVKYWMLNNENVKNFVSSRNNVKDVDSATLAGYRKMRGQDLTELQLKWLAEFVRDVFKEHSSVEKGVMSPDLKKQLSSWFNTSGRYYNLPSWAMRELESIPNIRPTKRVLVYRGLLFSESSLTERAKYDGTLEVGDGLAFLRSVRKGSRTVDLTWDRPSSWTYSKDVASRFAQFGPASSSYSATLQWLGRGIKKIDGALGFVIATFAEPEDILIDTKMMRTNLMSVHGDEDELILKPGTFVCRIVKKYTVEAGEVDPDINSSEDSSEIDEMVSRVKSTPIDLPDDVRELIPDVFWGSSITDTMKKGPEAFASLVKNSTTSTVLNAYDQARQMYEDILKGNADKLKPEKYAMNQTAGKQAKLLSDLMSRFDQSVKHSKFAAEKNKSGKKSDLTAAEYRTTISSADVDSLENDLMRYGKITQSKNSYIVTALANVLGVKLPTSANLHMFGAAKQEPVIEDLVDKFFKYIDVAKPEDPLEAKKSMLNFLRKAQRNAVMIQELVKITKILGEL